MNSGLGRAVKIISKIVEISSWIGCGITAALIATLAFSRDLGLMKYFTDVTQDNVNATVAGFSIGLSNADGTPIFGAFMILFVTVLFVLILIALAFRNVNKVFKSAEDSTPFLMENVTRIKKIGYYIIAIPVVDVIMSLIAKIVIGINVVETSVDFSYIFAGIVVLAISQIFAYGVKLEADVDGLV